MSSENQAQSVSQTEAAVSEMDKVVQSNSANAEQISSASEELSAQAAGMKSVVNELVVFVNGEKAGNRPQKKALSETLNRPQRRPELTSKHTSQL